MFTSDLLHLLIYLFLGLTSAHLSLNHSLKLLGLKHSVDLLLLDLAVGVDRDDAERLAVPQAQQRLALALHDIDYGANSPTTGCLQQTFAPA